MQISGNFSVSGVDASRAATKSNAPAPAQAATQSAIATPVDQLELSETMLKTAVQSIRLIVLIYTLHIQYIKALILTTYIYTYISG